MVGLKKGLSLGIAETCLVFGSFLYSQNYQINQKFQKENLETKTLNYSINDSIKKQEEKIISKRKEFVENAKKYLGTEYNWGGRLTENNPGLDCLGLIFLPYAKTFGTKWTEISVNPSEIVEKKQLGKPVEGLEGVLTKDVDISKLEEGDIIYLLNQTKIKDKPLAEINGKKYWPWHTGIYSNKKENLFLHANPGAYPRYETKVVEYDFKEVLEDNDAIFVTRIY